MKSKAPATAVASVAIALLLVLASGVVASADPASAASPYGDPKETFQTFLAAVLQDDLESAKACWAISAGDRPKASVLYVEYLIFSLRFGDLVQTNFEDLEKQLGSATRLLRDAIHLTLRRLSGSSYEAQGDAATLAIAWQPDDEATAKQIFFSPGPVSFRKIGDAWKIEDVAANPFANRSDDPAGTAGYMRRALIHMKAAIGEFQKGNIQTSAQLLAAVNGKSDSPLLPRQIHFAEFAAIYYRMDKDGTRAYLCFSLPGYLVTGLMTGTMRDRNSAERRVTIEGIYAVADTEENRREYDFVELKNLTRTNDLWVREIDVGSGPLGKPGTFTMYYRNPQDQRAVEIPFQGTMD